MNIRNIRVVLRAGLGLAALAVAIGANADGTQNVSESSKIVREVMKACHATDVTQIVPVYTLTPLGRPFPTAEDEARYIADPAHFAYAQRASPCWTRDRWERFVHATAAQDRARYAKTQGH